MKAHFRKGWRDIQTLMDQKYAGMSKAFSLISVDGNTNPLLCHANDEWIKKKLPKSDPVRNELSAPFTKPGRNAMTLVPFYECLFELMPLIHARRGSSEHGIQIRRLSLLMRVHTLTQDTLGAWKSLRRALGACGTMLRTCQ